jgi:CheY-like chemotaxis protein
LGKSVDLKPQEMSNILIVDDSDDLLEMLSVVFKRRTYSIMTANNKTALYANLQRMTPDIILIDTFLKEDDGREICKGLKQNNQFKNIPIILMSGHPVVLQDYKDFYADDILDKPFSIDQLLAKLKSILGKLTNA